MRAFRREAGDLVAEVDPGEREVLATVVADVAELLGAGRLEDRAGRRAPGAEPAVRLRLDPVPVPDDPAVLRLLPDASRDDPAVAAEFRRLTEDDLRQDKIDRLAELYDLVRTPVVRVPVDRGARLAATLADVRLVLGERLGVTDEQASEDVEAEVVHGEPSPDDRAAQIRHYLGSVFLALGWWQETLMACLLADLDRREG